MWDLHVPLRVEDQTARTGDEVKVLVSTLVAMSLLAAGCSSDATAKETLAESIGTQLAVAISTPLDDYAISRDVGDLTELLTGAINDLALPGGVEQLSPGSEMNSGSNGVFGWVSTSIAVFRTDETDFCMVVAIGSDGQIEAHPAAAEPVQSCGSAPLPKLEPPSAES